MKKQPKKPKFEVVKPIHLLTKLSTTKCGYFLYRGGILIENTTTDKNKVTCRNCLHKK